MRPKTAKPTSDRLISRIATHQHGIVSLTQLRAAGIAPRTVARRVQAGSLHRIYRGVFAVGHPSLSKEGRWLAAVLACDQGAALSHRSAAALWDMAPVPSHPVDVTVPTTSGRSRRAGLAVHRSSTLLPGEVVHRRAIPVTNPARTLRDLRPMLTEDHFESVLRRAEVLRLDIGQHPRYVPDRARSELERLFLALCRAHLLSIPEMNVRVGPFEVDFLWRDHALIVEADGYRHHGTRSAFEADRARDMRLRALGYQVLRLTHRQVVQDADAVASTLTALLAGH